MIAADEVDVRGEQRAGADNDPAGREHFAIEPDVGAVADLDVAVLARQDGVAPDEDAAPDPDAGVGVAFRVEETVVVDDDVVADLNLVRMAQHDVLAEDDIPPDFAEQEWIEDLPQRQSERARRGLSGQRDEFVENQRPPASTADDERTVLVACAAAGSKELVLRAGNVAGLARVKSIAAHGTTPACAECHRAG